MWEISEHNYLQCVASIKALEVVTVKICLKSSLNMMLSAQGNNVQSILGILPITHLLSFITIKNMDKLVI